MGAVGLDTPRIGVEMRIRSPARTGQEARCTPLCGVLLMGAVVLDTPTEWGGEEN